MTSEHPLPNQARSSGDAANLDAAARALRVQILASEHWSLLATRNLSWNESFSRSTMFLTVLTGAVVALALVAQATASGEAFMVFALLLLPVVLFVGCATFVRLGEINTEDLIWVQGMNRIRRGYLEVDPGIEPYLIAGATEDPSGVLRTYGAGREAPSLRGNFMHALVTTPATIAFVDCVLAAVLAGLVLTQLGSGMASSALGAAVTFVVAFVLFAVYSSRKAAAFWLQRSANRD